VTRTTSAPLAIVAATIVCYLLTPSAPLSLLRSWPLAPAGAAMLALAIGAGVLAHRLRARSSWTRPIAAGAVTLVFARLALAMVVTPTGWLASYYANDGWQGEPQFSSDYRFAVATRLDHSIAFEAGGFPVFYLNGANFPDGDPRETTEAMSADWRGVFALGAAERITINLSARGVAVVDVDGQTVIDDSTPVKTGSTAVKTGVQLESGIHRTRVRYSKPAGQPGRLRVSLSGPSNPITIFPEGTVPGSQALLRAAASVCDAVVVGLLLLLIGRLLVITWQTSERASLVGPIVVCLLFGVQGFVTALGYRTFRTLTGGDDWFGFESRARDILQHGLLMTLGRPLGQGEPYFYHPFYSYFLAAVHAVTGESLFGPIFANFLILAVTALVVGGLVARVFGRRAAAAGVVALVFLFEIDFVRYYTTTLLSENLYVLTVACCLAAFARWAGSGRLRTLAAAGAWGGLSSVTRPAMLVFFVPAAVLALVIGYRRHRASWALAPVVICLAWLAVVLPFTARNWMVSNQFVLVSSGQERTVVLLNVPPPIDPQPYVDLVASGRTGTIGALWHVASDHPGAFAALQLRKFGFTLGMIHWFQPYRPHPELIAITALYVLTLIFSPKMRNPDLWPVHAFVASHWASMALTSPWNYGYRLILPPFVYTTALSMAAAWPLGVKAGVARP